MKISEKLGLFYRKSREEYQALLRIGYVKKHDRRGVDSSQKELSVAVDACRSHSYSLSEL